MLLHYSRRHIGALRAPQWRRPDAPESRRRVSQPRDRHSRNAQLRRGRVLCARPPAAWSVRSTRPDRGCSRPGRAHLDRRARPRVALGAFLASGVSGPSLVDCASFEVMRLSARSRRHSSSTGTSRTPGSIFSGSAPRPQVARRQMKDGTLFHRGFLHEPTAPHHGVPKAGGARGTVGSRLQDPRAARSKHGVTRETG